MKILLFTDCLGAGGAQRQLVGLAKLLNQEKYDVSVLTYHRKEFYVPFLQNLKIEYKLLECNGNKIKRIFNIVMYVCKKKPDVIIAYQSIPSIIACIAKIFNNKTKLIVSERTTTQSISRNDKIRFFLYRYADKIVPNSYSQEKFIKNHFPSLSDKITTIINFVDLDYFKPIERKREHNNPIIMIAATIYPTKNTLQFIEAVNLLKNCRLKFKVKWYGYIEEFHEYYKKAIDKIEEYMISDYIQLLPKTLNIKECYNEADYFCLPSYFEGTPNVICEAMASGLPVVCSDVCDNSKYVHECENGFLFNPNSPDSIAEKIEKLLRLSDNEYKLFSIKSREIAEKLLSEDKFINKYIDIIQQ